jgi:hypothetical protein
MPATRLPNLSATITSNQEALMACNPELLKGIPLFALLEDEDISGKAPRSEIEIQGLSRKLNLLDEKIGDVAHLLRKGNSRVTD